MRLVEELAQGLDVDVLVPAHHEDAGGAGRCIPAACKVGSRQGSAAGPGPTRSGPELSRDPGPTSAVEPRLAHQHLSGAPLEAQLPGGRVGAGHHLREGAVGASGRTGHPRDPPLPIPLCPLTTSGGSTSTSSMLPTALASRSPGGPGAAARAAACRRPRGLGRGFSSAPPLGARHPAGSRLPPAPTEAPPRGLGQAPGALAPDAPKAPQGPGGAGAG